MATTPKKTEPKVTADSGIGKRLHEVVVNHLKSITDAGARQSFLYALGVETEKDVPALLEEADSE